MMWKFKPTEPSYYSSPVDDTSISEGMLLEDIRLSIVPFTGSRRFDVSIEPSDRNVEELVRIGFGGERYEHDLYGTLADFVRDCAYQLCAYGKCSCHIHTVEQTSKISRAGDPEKIFQARLLRSDLIKKHFLKLYYPTRDPANLIKSVWKSIPANELVVFDLNEVNHKWLLTTYPILNHIDRISHLMPDVDNYTKQLSWKVDPIQNIKLCRTAMAYFTAPIGWNGRNLFNEYYTDYYWIYRKLNFEEFLSHLRTYIFKKMNECLQKACKQLQIEAKFIIDELCTVESISKLREQLMSGRKIVDIHNELMDRQNLQAT